MATLSNEQTTFLSSAYALAYRLQDSDDANLFDASTAALNTARTILSNVLGAVVADEVHALMCQREQGDGFEPAKMLRSAIEKVEHERAEYRATGGAS